MAHNRRRQRLEDVFEPERREEMVAAFLDRVTVNEVEDWFTEPWRDGRNAVRLALTVIPSARHKASDEDLVAHAWLFEVLAKDHSALTSEDYQRANDLKYEVSRAGNVRYSSMTYAALEIYANWIARSDGGGVVPNIHLNTAFARAIWDGELDEREAHEDVGLWRSVDAGIDWRRIGDGSEEGKRAATHRWLWMNRRLLMANTFARVRS